MIEQKPRQIKLRFRKNFWLKRDFKVINSLMDPFPGNKDIDVSIVIQIIDDGFKVIWIQKLALKPFQILIFKYF